MMIFVLRVQMFLISVALEISARRCLEPPFPTETDLQDFGQLLAASLPTSVQHEQIQALLLSIQHLGKIVAAFSGRNGVKTQAQQAVSAAIACLKEPQASNHSKSVIHNCTSFVFLQPAWYLVTGCLIYSSLLSAKLLGIFVIVTIDSSESKGCVLYVSHKSRKLESNFCYKVSCFSCQAQPESGSSTPSVNSEVLDLAANQAHDLEQLAKKIGDPSSWRHALTPEPAKPFLCCCAGNKGGGGWVGILIGGGIEFT